MTELGSANNEKNVTGACRARGSSGQKKGFLGSRGRLVDGTGAKTEGPVGRVAFLLASSRSIRPQAARKSPVRISV